MKVVPAKIDDGMTVSSQERALVEDSRRRLVWHGMFLFLLGLVTGSVEENFANWAVTLLAAILGTAAMSPISAGRP